MTPISNAGMLMRMNVDALKASGNDSISQSTTKEGGFSDIMKSAISNVTEAQNSAKVMGEQFSVGNPNVSLVDAKIASEVAEVKTQILIASTQKILKAYRDISNMSV